MRLSAGTVHRKCGRPSPAVAETAQSIFDIETAFDGPEEELSRDSISLTLVQLITSHANSEIRFFTVHKLSSKCAVWAITIQAIESHPERMIRQSHSIINEAIHNMSGHEK